jgi:hypothetical protein
MMLDEQRFHSRQELVMKFDNDYPCPIGLKLINDGL